METLGPGPPGCSSGPDELWEGRGMQKPCQPGAGSMCRWWGEPGRLLSVQTNMFWHCFSYSESTFFSVEKKVLLEYFQPGPHPTTQCRPTGRDGWHLPLLFYSHVNLPWCGAGFSTNRLAVLPYPSIFEVSAALPAVREL